MKSTIIEHLGPEFEPVAGGSRGTMVCSVVD